MLALIVLLMVMFVSPAHATIFWDDEMETGSVMGENSFLTGTLIPAGSYTIDTNTKYSGTGSIRINFQLACDIPGPSLAGQCGGSLTRTFTDQASIWKRVYFMMSGSSTPLTAPSSNCITTNCLFSASRLSSTKMLQGQSLDNSAFAEKNIRHWWQIGKVGGKNFINSQEHVPTYNQTTDEFTSITLQDNRWYCIETHEVVNTAGVANGIAQAWVDGVQVLNDTNVLWQRAASATAPGNFLWHQFQIIRQNGAGYFWWDRLAAADARIGCIGTPPPVDTTNPNPPTNFTAQ
mgnify:CR=1 FL=1